MFIFSSSLQQWHKLVRDDNKLQKSYVFRDTIPIMSLNEEKVAVLTFLPGLVHGGQRRQISLPQSEENQGKGVTSSYPLTNSVPKLFTAY